MPTNKELVAAAKDEIDYTLSGTGANPGDSISWPSVPLLKGSWAFASPQVEFVPTAKVGLGYVPVGYV